MSILILRPTSDVSPCYLASTAGAGSHYTTLDEETADDDDHVSYTSASSGSMTDKYGFGDATVAGTINSVKFVARCKSTKTGSNTGVNFYVYNWGTKQLTTLSWATYSRTLTTRDGTNPWTWDAVNALVLTLSLGVDNCTTYCSQLYVEVDYTPTVYFDEIVCYGRSNGYAEIIGILKDGAASVVKQRAQIASDDAFSDILADTTELTKSGDAGDTLSLVVTWSPTTAGTYWARFGVQAAADSGMTWCDAAFVVHFPVLSSVSLAHLNGPLYRITVVVSDDYADPPEVSVTIDGQAGMARLT